jgi:hypothetical protein
LHSYVRFAAAAALIAFGGIIGAGAIALVPAALERIPAIRAEGPPENACDPQTRLPWDRSCQMATASPQQPPASAPREAANVAAAEVPPPARTVEVPPPARTVEVPSPARTVDVPSPARTVEVPAPARTTPEPPVRDSARAATARQAAAGEPPTFEPSLLAPPTGGTPSTFTSSPPVPPTLPADAAPQSAAVPAVAAQPRAPAANESAPRASAAKKASRREQTAKRSTNTNEALGVVRRFGETLPEIPVRSYAPDGTQRTIVIRPTNIQDSYYYSAPR